MHENRENSGMPDKRYWIGTSHDARSNAARRLISALPVFEWLRGYQNDWLRPDLIAGLTAAAVVIPKAMAYATIAGLPVQVGLIRRSCR